jgi:hypothetical protein
LKAIVKKRKNYLKLKIIPDTGTEKRFLEVLLQYEKFCLMTKDSVPFIVRFVKCDTCMFNEFYEEWDGIRNGEHCKIKVGKCKCPKIEDYKKIGCHTLENEFRNCIEYQPIPAEEKINDNPTDKEKKAYCQSRCGMYKADHSACHYCEDWRTITKIPDDSLVFPFEIIKDEREGSSQ